MTLTRFQSRPSAAPEGAPRLHVVTFGCQMNKYDSLLVEGCFKGRGYGTTGDPSAADVVLINTCSVREHAEERAWSWLGELQRARQARPELVIGVMGCMAQRVGDEVFRRAGHVDVVCGTRQLQHMADLVEEVRARRRDPDAWRARDRRICATGTDEDVVVDRAGTEYAGGRHAWLAVMRGCDLGCTFCIVPATRGRVQSRPLGDILAEARWLVDQGAQVVTLLGQTVNSYGEDLPAPAAGRPRQSGRRGRPGLADVLRALQEVEGLERVRLVTLHPAYLTRALAEALRDCDKVERFLPLPAQAGSDRVLKAMRRGYTLDLYRERVAMLRELVPDVELGSDWIVGFPGESEQDFLGSLAFLEEVGFVVNYVFKYDPRPGTPAAERLRDDVPLALKKERNARLLAKAEEVALRRTSRWVGRTLAVFVEEGARHDGGPLRGRSRHGLPVSVHGDESLCGREVPVIVRQASAYGMSGEHAAEGATVWSTAISAPRA